MWLSQSAPENQVPVTAPIVEEAPVVIEDTPVVVEEAPVVAETPQVTETAEDPNRPKRRKK